jgi:transposase-like protein
MEKRRNYKPEKKAKILLEVLREEKTLTEATAYYKVHPNQLSQGKGSNPFSLTDYCSNGYKAPKVFTAAANF